MIQANYDKARL